MNLWFRSFRVRLSRLEIIREIGKIVGEGFAVFSAKLEQMGCGRCRACHRVSRRMLGRWSGRPILDNCDTELVAPERILVA
jgi:hypothetical protein